MNTTLSGECVSYAHSTISCSVLYLFYHARQIDSALDTHKVRRVAAMLAARTSDGNEQCIVISHRPEMHERAR